MSAHGKSDVRSPQYGEGKQALIEATIRIVSRGGLRSLTHRKVSEEAGLANGLVRHYFGTLDNLVKTALDQVVENSISSSDLNNKPQNVSEFASHLSQSVIQAPDQQQFQYELVIEATRNPDLAPAISELYEQYQSATKAALDSMGIEGGVDLAYLINATLDGLVIQQLSQQSSEKTDRALGVLRDILSVYKDSQ